MRIGDLKDYVPGEAAAGYDLLKSRQARASVPEEQQQEALAKVDEAQEANTRTTLDMMDRHNEMVKKSQELAGVRDRKRAIERMSLERREEQTELLAQVALRNAERRDLFEDLRTRA
jgi:hypothetical protein